MGQHRQRRRFAGRAHVASIGRRSHLHKRNGGNGASSALLASLGCLAILSAGWASSQLTTQQAVPVGAAQSSSVPLPAATQQQRQARAQQAARVSRSTFRRHTGIDISSRNVVAIANQRTAALQALEVQSRAYAHILESEVWTYPTTGFRISTWFGEAGSRWSSGYHTGIDMSAPLGTPVVAITNATVVSAGWDGPYGNQVRIQLSNGDQAWYNHLSRIDVGAGQTVTRGETLGAIGDTGNSFGSHLHFEYRYAADTDTPVDPVSVLASHDLGL